MYRGSERGRGLVARYCPRCDAAVGFLSETEVDPLDATVVWRREGTQLELRPDCLDTWAKVPEKLRDTWEGCVRHYVAAFLRGRAADDPRCLSDGEATRVVHAERDERGVSWRYSWCERCRTGVLAALDRDYGWELCFAVVGGANGFPHSVLSEYPAATDHPEAREVLRRLPPVDGK